MVSESPMRTPQTASLTPEQAAKLLSAAGKRRITVEMIRADIEAGAPTHPDGTLHLIHYTAWLVKQAAQGGE